MSPHQWTSPPYRDVPQPYCTANNRNVLCYMGLLAHIYSSFLSSPLPTTSPPTCHCVSLCQSYAFLSLAVRLWVSVLIHLLIYLSVLGCPMDFLRLQLFPQFEKLLSTS
ncbi:expressed protein [Echinococcus multilocularis]|uniref:Expressed protein n=1 Tax=Echinococcus multilocularis TaxID=6211 RepID=A0A087W1I9_ECHMU|nr:expressed protein [Echinococcus multilocularis]